MYSKYEVGHFFTHESLNKNDPEGQIEAGTIKLPLKSEY